MKIHTIFNDPADGVVALLYAHGHHRLTDADFRQAATATLAEHVYDNRRPGWLGKPHHDAAARLFHSGPTYEFAHRLAFDELQRLSTPIPLAHEEAADACIVFTPAAREDGISTPVTVLAIDDTRFRELAHVDAIAEIVLLDLAQDRRLGEFTTDEDFALAAKIADRAAALYSTRSDVRRNRTEILMTIIAVHERCMPLRFADWLAVENNPRFVHDIIGIDQHLDRGTLQLKATFCPRFAA